MPEPGSLAGLSGVEKAENEVSELKLKDIADDITALKKKLKDIADDITALKKKLKDGVLILQGKGEDEGPWKLKELQNKLPFEVYEVFWTKEDCHNPAEKFVTKLEAEIAELKKEKEDLTALLLEEKKQVTEEKKQVTAEKEKEKLLLEKEKQGPRVPTGVKAAAKPSVRAVTPFSKAAAKPSGKGNVKKPKRNHDSSPQQRQGVTPLSNVRQSKKRAASEPGLDPVPAPDLEGRTATPMAWRVELKVPGGITRRGLRRGVIELAQDHVGYEGSFDYPKTGDIYTKDTPFMAIVYFETRRDAAVFMNTVEKRQLAPRGLKLGDCEVKESEEPHSLQNRVVFSSHYDSDDSPEAAREDFECTDAPVSITESSHTSITPERKQHESLAKHGSDYEDAHIIERQTCRGPLSSLDKDPTNRLILPGYVHKLYDGRYPDFVGPGLSFYCEEEHANVPRETLVEMEVIMHVFYGEFTSRVLPWMPLSKPFPRDSNKHIFTIRHRDPYRLKVLLNVRYGRDVSSSSQGEKPRPYTKKELEELKAVCEPTGTDRGNDTSEDISGSKDASGDTTSGSSSSESGDS